MSDHVKKECGLCGELSEKTQDCLNCGLVFCTCEKHKSSSVSGTIHEDDPHCPKCHSKNVTI